jgi:hypothetical protein
LATVAVVDCNELLRVPRTVAFNYQPVIRGCKDNLGERLGRLSGDLDDGETLRRCYDQNHSDCTRGQGIVN